MVKPEIVRKWREEKATGSVQDIIKEFSDSHSGQVNLASSCAQKDLAKEIVVRLIEQGIIRSLSREVR